MTALHFAGSDWSVSLGEIDYELADALQDCGTPGQDATDSVAYVRETFTVTGDPDDCAAYLKVMGAWDAEELANHDNNLNRLVWLAGCDLRESGEAHFSTY